MCHFHSPDAADSTSFDVQLGDIILTATDGLFDNMPDYMILQELKKLKVSGRDSERLWPPSQLLPFLLWLHFTHKRPTTKGCRLNLPVNTMFEQGPWPQSALSLSWVCSQAESRSSSFGTDVLSSSQQWVGGCCNTRGWRGDWGELAVQQQALLLAACVLFAFAVVD